MKKTFLCAVIFALVSGSVYAQSDDIGNNEEGSDKHKRHLFKPLEPINEIE